MGGGTQGAAMAIFHPMFLEVGPRLWPGVARVKGVARGGHMTITNSLQFHSLANEYGKVTLNFSCGEPFCFCASRDLFFAIPNSRCFFRHWVGIVAIA